PRWGSGPAVRPCRRRGGRRLTIIRPNPRLRQDPPPAVRSSWRGSAPETSGAEVPGPPRPDRRPSRPADRHRAGPVIAGEGILGKSCKLRSGGVLLPGVQRERPAATEGEPPEMTASRTAKLLLAGALGLGSAVTVAAPALADTPPAQQGLVIVLADDDGGFEGPGEIAQPTPAPTPEAPKDKAPGLQQPEPLPGPQPELPIDGGGGHGDPQPGDFPIAGAPEDDGPVVNPDLGEGPGDLTDDPGCTHGCGPDPDPECHPLVAACDLTDREPSDDPGDDEE